MAATAGDLCARRFTLRSSRLLSAEWFQEIFSNTHLGNWPAITWHLMEGNRKTRETVSESAGISAFVSVGCSVWAKYSFTFFFSGLNNSWRLFLEQQVTRGKATITEKKEYKWTFFAWHVSGNEASLYKPQNVFANTMSPSSCVCCWISSVVH